MVSASNSKIMALANKIKELIATKVDKIEGKGLSTNDFNYEYKNIIDEVTNVTYADELYFYKNNVFSDDNNNITISNGYGRTSNGAHHFFVYVYSIFDDLDFNYILSFDIVFHPTSNDEVLYGYYRESGESLNNGNPISQMHFDIYYNEGEGAFYTNNVQGGEIEFSIDNYNNGWMSFENVKFYKPTLNVATVAKTGSYNDLSNKPTIPDISGKIDTAGTGLSKSGTTLNHSNSVTALTTASLKKVKYDAQGHITGTSDVNDSDLPSHTHTKSQVTDFPSTMPPSSHTHGDITSDGAMTTSSVDKDTNDFPIVADSSNSKKLQRGFIYTGFVWDNYARPNIGTEVKATQTAINDGIDKELGKRVTKGIIDGGTNLLQQRAINAGSGGVNYTIGDVDFHYKKVYGLNLSSVSDTTKYNDLQFKVDGTELQYNDIVTFSFWAKTTSGTPIIKTYLYGDSGYVGSKRLVSNSTVSGNNTEASSFNDGNTSFQLSTTWTKYYVTYLQNSSGTINVGRKASIRVYGGSAQIYVADVKLERGHNATDWSSHPSAITERRIKASSTSTKDLNDYTQAGFYYNDFNADCTYISNLPEAGKAFFLLVEDWERDNCAKQTITHYGTGTTYTRILNNNTWGSWTTLAKTSQIPSASSSAPLVNYYKTGGIVGTSTNYARADHRHTPFFSYSTGGDATAGYINILEISVTDSWNDKPITFELQQRAKQTPTYVSIKLSNTNITSANYTIDKFVIWGSPMTLYLKQVDTNKWHLIAYKSANDGYYVNNLFGGNGATEFVRKNTKWGSSAPTNETNAPLYTATYIVGATPFEATATNIKANGTQGVGSLNTVARADHVHPHNCVNNLTSTSTTAPLAANQGKVLNAKFDTASIGLLKSNDLTAGHHVGGIEYWKVGNIIIYKIILNASGSYTMPVSTSDTTALGASDLPFTKAMTLTPTSTTNTKVSVRVALENDEAVLIFKSSSGSVTGVEMTGVAF